jgi:hypothetical protein
MTDWTTIRAHMRTKFSLELDSTEGVSLTWNLESGAVQQKQWLHPVQAFGLPHLLVICAVCDERQLPARDAIRHNNSLAAGSLALGPHGYVMRAVIPMDALSFAALDRMLEMMAHEAARIRVNVERARAA